MVCIRCTVCAQDPVSLQFCGAVNRNETNRANLNASCSGSENCSEECQIAVDNVSVATIVCRVSFRGAVALGFLTSIPSSPPESSTLYIILYTLH